MKRDTELICECGFKWWERLDFDIERRYRVEGVDGLMAYALTVCPKCGYQGLARGIIPANRSPLKFYLKREFSIYFPRGGWKPSLNLKDFDILVNPAELHVHLYDEPSLKTLNLEEIANYLKHEYGVPVDLRSSPLHKEFIKSKIYDFSNPNFKPSIELETKQGRLCSLTVKAETIYDGFKLQVEVRNLLRKSELNLQHVHIIFTNLLFATWDDDDQRYHARIAIYGFPNLISTTGIVEAPAKPREFYRLKREGVKELLKDQLSSKIIDYNDPRLTEIMKGYVMQAVLYHLVGAPFCIDAQCRLFNAHWHEEIIKAQLSKPEYCAQHETFLNSIMPSYRNV